MAPTLTEPTQNPHSDPKQSTRPPTDPNVLEVVFGNLLIRPWYPSFYPEALVGRTVGKLYVCPWCFKYSKELMGFLGHLRVCGSRVTGPPGEEIYRKGGYSLYEVDGEEHKVYIFYSIVFWDLCLQSA